MSIELGIIEGYYGKPWTWEERAETIGFLGPRGFGFYLYAPKADIHLRRLWREPFPNDHANRLADLAAHCRALGVRFGVGLSPTKLQAGLDAEARAALESKLAALDELRVDDLAILFDDMRGDVPGLADRQIEIVHWMAGRTRASRILVCPSYYTDDPVLDRVFGARPAGYVERMGAGLDAGIELFWTGEEVISREISIGHVQRVAEQLRRKPFLWDNYPVNDGERMSQYLHLRGVSGRRGALADYVAGHGMNPALQPTLTRIPALTLAESYRLGDAYEYTHAFARAAAEVLGPALAARVREDVLTLQDIGLDRLGDKEGLLRERYASVRHPGAREIIAWLDGEYRITDAIVAAQSGED